MSILARPFSAASARVAVLAVTAMVLTACSGDAWWKGKPETRPCPTVSVLADAATITVFKDGAGRDLTDVLHEGRFEGYKGACAYDVDSDTGTGTLEVELLVSLRVARGPADTQRRAALNYFVSVTDADRNVLSKQVFDVVAEFPGNKTQVKLGNEPVYLTLPLQAGQTGADYNVFVGFQVTREQLDYNRQNRAN